MVCGHVLRSTNQCADHMAKLGALDSTDSILWESPPHALLRFLYEYLRRGEERRGVELVFFGFCLFYLHYQKKV